MSNGYVKLDMAFVPGDKRQLITSLCILLSIGFAATTLVNYYVSKATIRESIIASELPLTSDNLYSEIQKDLIRPLFVASTMASNTFLRDWIIAGERDVEKIIKYLREIKQRYGAFTSFFISERTRIYYQTDGVLKKVQENEPRDAWYFRVRGIETPYEISFDPDFANQDVLTTFINFRVFDYDDRYIGVAGIGIAVDTIRGLIDKYQKLYRCKVYFFDRKDGALLFSSGARVGGATIRNVEGLGVLGDRIMEQGAGSYQYQSAGRDYLLNVRLISEFDWYLLVERAEDDALTGIRNTLYLNLAISIIISAIVLLATSFTINRYQGRLEEMATTDKLTGLANRQAFDLLMPQAISESRRSQTPLLAIMIDIDRFKEVNDGYGHLAGDSVLKQVANVLKATLRQSDLVCRWGGEEFLVVLKVPVDSDRKPLAEKIRSAVEHGTFRHADTVIHVTISLGIAAYIDGETPEQLIARADKALYEAKARGRNQVRSADESPSST